MTLPFTLMWMLIYLMCHLQKGEFDTEIKLTKDKDGNWVISQDDYKTLLSELVDRTEGYDTIDRSGSTNKKATDSSETSTDKDKSKI